MLAAGAGTRLRDISPVKPLAEVAGRPLIVHVIDRLRQAGVGEVVVVTGYEADRVGEAVEGIADVQLAHNPDWRQPNGVSVLAAAPYVAGRALLTMSDHLSDPALYRAVAAAGQGDRTVLGIDRRLGHPWIDEEDVTRVATDGDRIVGIGKLIEPYDAYDTGTFGIGQPLFEALRSLDRPSLSDGMRLLADKGLAATVDVSGLDWLDVDDARAFDIAGRWLSAAT